LTLAVGFWTDFSDQGYPGLLLIGTVAALVYGGIVVLTALNARAEVGNFRALCWGALTALIWVVALVFLEAVAHYHRRVPGGSEFDRRGEAFDEWQLAAQTAFITLCVAALLFSAGGGFLINRGGGAVRSTFVLVCFFLVTWPFVWYMNQCEVGFGSWLGDGVCV
jgi:hypothetical protein